MLDITVTYMSVALCWQLHSALSKVQLNMIRSGYNCIFLSSIPWCYQWQIQTLVSSISRGWCGKVFFTLVQTLCQLTCVNSPMSLSLLSLKVHINISILNYYFILPVTRLNLSIQDTLEDRGGRPPMFQLRMDCI